MTLAFEADTRVLQGLINPIHLAPNHIISVCESEVAEAIKFCEPWKRATEAAMQVGHHLINCKVCQMSLTIGDNLCDVHRRLVVDMVEKRDAAIALTETPVAGSSVVRE